MEKMLMLHEMYHYEGLSERHLEGGSRQLYEIVLLYEQLRKEGAPVDKKLYNALRTHRHNWMSTSSWMLRGSSLNRLCFVPPHFLLGRLMDDYRKLRKETVFGSVPDFPALIGNIQQINGNINGRAWHVPVRKVSEAVNGENVLRCVNT